MCEHVSGSRAPSRACITCIHTRGWIDRSIHPRNPTTPQTPKIPTTDLGVHARLALAHALLERLGHILGLGPCRVSQREAGWCWVVGLLRQSSTPSQSSPHRHPHTRRRSSIGRPPLHGGWLFDQVWARHHATGSSPQTQSHVDQSSHPPPYTPPLIIPGVCPRLTLLRRHLSNEGLTSVRCGVCVASRRVSVGRSIHSRKAVGQAGIQ